VKRTSYEAPRYAVFSSFLPHYLALRSKCSPQHSLLNTLSLRERPCGSNVLP